MFIPFRNVAVLGAGVMGSQISAHLANAGLTVHLLDLAAPTGDKNALVETAFRKALKFSPPICFSEKSTQRISLGNFEDDWQRLAEVDWIIEAIVEQLPAKQALMERLESVVKSDAIISSNTSGLSLAAIAQGRSQGFRQRFLGTHFFNPPRYLKLLELIPTPDTDPQVLARLQWFGERHLGKGIVIAKDTPNFIANRIGLYGTLSAIRAWTEGRYTIAEIDTLTGTLIGRPKSATFRTADLIGLDTLTLVADHLYPVLTNDESREAFRVPDILRKMVATGTLGVKTGQGFYKKQKSEILSLNPDTLSYEALTSELPSLATISPLKLPDRLQALYQDSSRAGAFFRQTMLDLLAYTARRIPEIADSPLTIDRALRWGFGWTVGPFELWDLLGWERVSQDLRAEGVILPEWLEGLALEPHPRFYQGNRLLATAVYQPDRGFTPIPIDKNKIDLSVIQADPERTIWQNEESSLLDLGDRVLLFEFHSKGRTLSSLVLQGLEKSLGILENRDYIGLVIGNDSENFCGGANLAEIAGAAQSGKLEVVEKLLIDFQTLLQRIHAFPKPIVAAVRGRVLGGGCELMMACPQVVAAAESYIGLVEVGVGLIPAGGGLLRSVQRTVKRAASESPSQVFPWLKQAFETIATAKVSGSAEEAKHLGFLPETARIVMNSDSLLAVAKAEVLHRQQLDYLPPPENDQILVLARPASASLDHAAFLLQQSGYASEYDCYLAHRIALVLTGGELSAPAHVSQSYLLQLERENFLPLLNESKTHERIAHLLKTKKPLRN